MQTRRKHNHLCLVVRSRRNVLCVQCHSGYGPFSAKIFGSKHVCAGFKLHFMKSLVLIRFFYQDRIWTPCPKAMRIINYLRCCMMRILGELGFDAIRITFDFQISQQMMQTSIDCLLMRRRLLYIRRILSNRCNVLRILLSHFASWWVKLVVQDLNYIHAHNLHAVAMFCGVSSCTRLVSFFFNGGVQYAI